MKSALQDLIYIVFELMEGGDLYSLLASETMADELSWYSRQAPMSKHWLKCSVLIHLELISSGAIFYRKHEFSRAA